MAVVVAFLFQVQRDDIDRANHTRHDACRAMVVAFNGVESNAEAGIRPALSDAEVEAIRDPTDRALVDTLNRGTVESNGRRRQVIDRMEHAEQDLILSPFCEGAGLRPDRPQLLR
jgi:hypothetical protein